MRNVECSDLAYANLRFLRSQFYILILESIFVFLRQILER